MPKPMHYADVDDAGTIYSYPNGADNTVGNGNPAGRQFQDWDDMYQMEGFNVIEHGQSAAFNMAERTTVDVSKADRGREA